MSAIFNFDELTDYDLYHLRFGRGAVIVAVPMENPAETEPAWTEHYQSLVQEARRILKPRKEEIGRRLVELKSALSSLMMAQRQSGVWQGCRNEPDPEEAGLVAEIETLEHEKNRLWIPPMRYRSNLQLAMFYTHDFSAGGDTDTRFDRVLGIAESSTHLTISLVFDDHLAGQHKYHGKILRVHGAAPGCPGQGTGAISGIVKRVVPIDSVTLEIVSRPEVRLEDLVGVSDLEPCNRCQTPMALA